MSEGSEIMSISSDNDESSFKGAAQSICSQVMASMSEPISSRMELILNQPAMNVASRTGKSFQITAQAMTQEDYNKLVAGLQLAYTKGQIKYARFAEGTAPTTGSKHTHIYINCGQITHRVAAIRKITGLNRAHYEICRGTWEQNMQYLDDNLKESTTKPVEYKIGDCPEWPVPVRKQTTMSKAAFIGHEEIKKKKTFKEQLEEVVKNCRNEMEVALKYPDIYARNCNSLPRIIAYNQMTQPKPKPTIIWVYGCAGCGKSALPGEFAPPHEVGRCCIQGWMDGYHQTEDVVIDDLRDTTFGYSHLLNITDIYCTEVSVKGRVVPWRPKRIWITSPEDPTTALRVEAGRETNGIKIKRARDDITQILRRLTIVMTKNCNAQDDEETRVFCPFEFVPCHVDHPIEAMAKAWDEIWADRMKRYPAPFRLTAEKYGGRNWISFKLPGQREVPRVMEMPDEDDFGGMVDHQARFE